MEPQLLDKLQDEGDNQKRPHGFEYLMTTLTTIPCYLMTINNDYSITNLV